MGIKDLLSDKGVKYAIQNGCLGSLKPQDGGNSPVRVGVDASTFIMKGFRICSPALFLDARSRGDRCRDDDVYNPVVSHFMKVMKDLKDAELVPVVCFDGNMLPLKVGETRRRGEKLTDNCYRFSEEMEEVVRPTLVEKPARDKKKTLSSKQTRAEQTALVQQRINALRNTDRGQYEKLQTKARGALSMDDDMVALVMAALDANDIERITAPYEADAQLVHLNRVGYVDAVLTEDSDVLPYGAYVTVFKWDRKKGMCDIVTRDRIFSVSEDRNPERFSSWTDDQFKLYCCLTGCDYIDRLKSLGPVYAYEIVSTYMTLEAVAKHLTSADCRLTTSVDDAYLLKLQRAYLAFQYHWVYDMEHKILIRLTEGLGDVYPIVGTDEERSRCMDLTFLGNELVGADLQDVVTGRLSAGSGRQYKTADQLVQDKLDRIELCRLANDAVKQKEETRGARSGTSRTSRSPSSDTSLPAPPFAFPPDGPGEAKENWVDPYGLEGVLQAESIKKQDEAKNRIMGLGTAARHNYHCSPSMSTGAGAPASDCDMRTYLPVPPPCAMTLPPPAAASKRKFQEIIVETNEVAPTIAERFGGARDGGTGLVITDELHRW